MSAESSIRTLLSPNGGIDKQILAASTEIILAAKAAGHDLTATSWFNPASTPEHHVPGMAGQKGVAVDFMVYRDTAMGNWIADYAWANRERLGICWIIWRDRIRYTSPGKSGNWVARGKGDHYDHPHINFGKLVGTNGSSRVTKITYRPPVGAPASLGDVWVDLLVPGVKNSTTWRLIQRALGVPETGEPDAATIAASKAYQQSLGDTVQDGWLGVKQVTRLFADKGMNVTIRTDASGQAPVVVPPVAKPPVVKPPTSTPKPDPKPEVPDVNRSFIFAYDNPLWNNDPRGGGWPKRCAPLIRQILSTGADVFAVCEIDPQQARDIYNELPKGWSYWRINGGDKYGPLAIYWRQAMFERTGNALEHEFSDNDSRYLLSVPLRHKPTGEDVWVDVVHFENNGKDKIRAGKRRKLQGTETAARTKNGKRIGGGDLNSTTLASGSNADKPRVIMGRAGLKFLTSQPSSKVANRSLASHHSDLKARPKGAWIDDIWWRGVTFNKGGLLPTSYSDHHILWANFTI